MTKQVTIREYLRIFQHAIGIYERDLMDRLMMI